MFVLDIEETSEYWNNVGKFTLAHVLQRQMQEKPAKNVILFMGDGMSLGTMTAGKNEMEHIGIGFLNTIKQCFFLRRFEEPKRSLKIVQRSLKNCFYNSVNKAKYGQEQ